MSKYDSSFKREVVDALLLGNSQSGHGARAIGKQFGIHDHRLIRQWLALYQHHGQAGLDPKYARYDAQFKLQVLQRLWQEGLSYSEAAALYDIRSRAAIPCWERQYHDGGIEALEPRPRGRLKKMTSPKPAKSAHKTDEERTLEELRQENEYLRAEVAYLKKWNALVQAKKAAAQKKRD